VFLSDGVWARRRDADDLSVFWWWWSWRKNTDKEIGSWHTGHVYGTRLAECVMYLLWSSVEGFVG